MAHKNSVTRRISELAFTKCTGNVLYFLEAIYFISVKFIIIAKTVNQFQGQFLQLTRQILLAISLRINSQLSFKILLLSCYLITLHIFNENDYFYNAHKDIYMRQYRERLLFPSHNSPRQKLFHRYGVLKKGPRYH